MMGTQTAASRFFYDFASTTMCERTINCAGSIGISISKACAPRQALLAALAALQSIRS